MEKIDGATERIPRFWLIAGIGAIAVYLLSSVPYVGIVSFLKVQSLKDANPDISSQEISDAIGDLVTSHTLLIGALVIQCASLFFYVWLVSMVRGTKNPFRDVGFRFTPSAAYYLLAGVGLQFVGIVLTSPFQNIIDGNHEQDVVTSVRTASGVTFYIFLFLVAFAVPVAEEVCFRGLFMRGLNKKVAPFVTILITGVLFAAVHLSDPKSFYGFTTLVAFGFLASGLAMYRGRLDASICLHIGFNLTTVIIIFLQGNNYISV